jgi:hypothetical protein
MRTGSARDGLFVSFMVLVWMSDGVKSGVKSGAPARDEDFGENDKLRKTAESCDQINRRGKKQDWPAPILSGWFAILTVTENSRREQVDFCREQVDFCHLNFITIQITKESKSGRDDFCHFFISR